MEEHKAVPYNYDIRFDSYHPGIRGQSRFCKYFHHDIGKLLLSKCATFPPLTPPRIRRAAFTSLDSGFSYSRAIDLHLIFRTFFSMQAQRSP
jgi:hypothetical protein